MKSKFMLWDNGNKFWGFYNKNKYWVRHSLNVAACEYSYDGARQYYIRNSDFPSAFYFRKEAEKRKLEKFKRQNLKRKKWLKKNET